MGSGRLRPTLRTSLAATTLASGRARNAITLRTALKASGRSAGRGVAFLIKANFIAGARGTSAGRARVAFNPIARLSARGTSAAHAGGTITLTAIQVAEDVVAYPLTRAVVEYPEP